MQLTAVIRLTIIVLFTLVAMTNNTFCVDTLKYFDSNSALKYFKSQINSFSVRFNNPTAIRLKEIIIYTDGNAGSFDLTILGNENMSAFPTVEKNIKRFSKVKKKKSGFELIRIKSDIILEKEHQFFITLCNLSPGLKILADIMPNKMCHTSSGKASEYNWLRKNGTQWMKHPYNLAIEIIIEKIDIENDHIFQKISMENIDSDWLNDRSFIAISDVNNDDLLDIAFNGLLLLNRDNFHFKAVNFEEENNYQASIFADYDSDGDSDLFLFPPENDSLSFLTILENDGSGNFQKHITNIKEFGKISSVAVGYLTNDLFPDILITCFDRQALILSNRSGDKNFNIIALPTIYPDDSTNLQCGLLDVDKDNRSELFFLNPYHGIKFFDFNIIGNEINLKHINNIPLGVLENSDSSLFMSSNIYKDNSGRKLLLSTDNPYPLNLNHSNSREIHEPVSVKFVNNFEGILRESAIGSSICKDINGNGLQDILRLSLCPCNPSKLFMLGKNGEYFDVSKESGFYYEKVIETAIFTDLNNDGMSDLIMLADGIPKIFKNTLQNENSVTVDYSNPEKSMESIEISLSNGNDLKAVTSDQINGFKTQSPYRTIFYSSSSGQGDSLRIESPKGVYYLPTEERKSEILHLNSGVVENLIETNFAVKILPNPFQDQTKIILEPGKSEILSISIYDNNGRKIKQIKNIIDSSGMISFIWDGSDDNGKKLSSGSYNLIVQCENDIKEFQLIKIN